MAARAERRPMRRPPPSWRSSSGVATLKMLYLSQTAVKESAPTLDTFVDLQGLKDVSSWVRDDLDPQIAREGPDVMLPDDVLYLHALLQHLQLFQIGRSEMSLSRIHHAVREIAGRASRWPRRLVDECDKVIKKWESDHGHLEKIEAALYEPGGRLHSISVPEDVTHESLLDRWKIQDPGLVDDARAYVRSATAYTPGQWWINAAFAFRDGIIDSETMSGGIVHDRDNAYAIVLRDNDELEGGTEEKFTYRTSSRDPGRYRLTAANPNSRQPVRVLRSHTLVSFCAPRAGIRYDGL